MSFWILTWGKIWKFRQKSRCITNLLESLVSKNPETNMQSPKQIFAKQKNWKIGIVCPCRHKRTLFWRFQTSCRFRRIDDMLFFGLATKGAIYWCEGAMDGGVGGQTAIGAAAISWHLSFFFSQPQKLSISHFCYLGWFLTPRFNHFVADSVYGFCAILLGCRFHHEFGEWQPLVGGRCWRDLCPELRVRILNFSTQRGRSWDERWGLFFLNRYGVDSKKRPSGESDFLWCCLEIKCAWVDDEWCHSMSGS